MQSLLRSSLFAGLSLLTACASTDCTRSGTETVGDYEAARISGSFELSVVATTDLAHDEFRWECVTSADRPDFANESGTLVIDAALDEPPCQIFLHGPRLANLYLDHSRDRIRFHIDDQSDLDLDWLEADRLEIAVSGNGWLSIDQLLAAEATVDLTGGGELWIGTIEAGTFALDSAGTADVELADVHTDLIRLEATGDSWVWAASETGHAWLDASGSAVIEASELTASSAEVAASGNAEVSLTVTGEVETAAQGSATLSIAEGSGDH